MLAKWMSIRSLIWVALVLALLGSIRHVAATFASIDGNAAFGWGQALAVDVGLLSLALGIAQRRKAKRSTRWLWVGTGIFSAISVYANAHYGLANVGARPPSVPNWMSLALPWVLSATLPLLALYLSEIVGSDIAHDQAQEERAIAKETRKLERQLEQAERQSVAEVAPTVAPDSNLDSAILTCYATDPLAPQARVAELVGKSRQRVGQRLAALEAEGVIRRNGHGVEVLT